MLKGYYRTLKAKPLTFQIDNSLTYLQLCNEKRPLLVPDLFLITFIWVKLMYTVYQGVSTLVKTKVTKNKKPEWNTKPIKNCLTLSSEGQR